MSQSLRSLLCQFQAGITNPSCFPMVAKIKLEQLPSRRRHWLRYFLTKRVSRLRTRGYDGPEKYAPLDPELVPHLRLFCDRHGLDYRGVLLLLAAAYEPIEAVTTARQKAEARWFRGQRAYDLTTPIFYALPFYAYLETGVWYAVPMTPYRPDDLASRMGPEAESLNEWRQQLAAWKSTYRPQEEAWEREFTAVLKDIFGDYI